MGAKRPESLVWIILDFVDFVDPAENTRITDINNKHL